MLWGAKGEPNASASMAASGHLQPSAGADPMSALTSKADIDLRSMPPHMAFLFDATSKFFRSPFANYSKVDPTDQIRTERFGGAYCGHRLSQSTDVRPKQHDSA